MNTDTTKDQAPVYGIRPKNPACIWAYSMAATRPMKP